MTKITITLTKGQLNQIAKQLASVDSEVFFLMLVGAPFSTPAPQPEAAKAPKKAKEAWACTLTRKADKAAYSAANVAGNRAVNAYVGQARKALTAGDEKALALAIKQALAVCRARVSAGAVTFQAIADGLEARIAR